MPDSSKMQAPPLSAPMLNLSAEQHRVLADLGIDAWYLHPLSRSDGDPAYQRQQTEIAEIVDSLSRLATSPQTATTSADTTELTPPNSKQSPEPVQAVVSATTKVLTGQSSRTTQALSPLSLAPIQLSTSANLTPPDNGVIDFPVGNTDKIEATGEAITAATAALPQKVSATLDTPALPDELNHTVAGTGSLNADWLIVMPPPMYRHLREKRLLLDQEQQLLTESLSAIGKNIDDVYVTPLLKQGVYKQKDPNAALSAAHLPILAAEIALIQPKRLILLGRTPSQVLLSTKAPLSRLTDGDYQLRLGDLTVPITLMPSLHYFLAVPAEKGILWQSLKRLA